MEYKVYANNVNQRYGEDTLVKVLEEDPFTTEEEYFALIFFICHKPFSKIGIYDRVINYLQKKKFKHKKLMDSKHWTSVIILHRLLEEYIEDN